MRIKHWQGYGTVSARKISDRRTTNTVIVNNNKSIAINIYDLIIEVTGDHEYGLVTEDKYNIFNWLLKNGTRFTSIASQQDILKIDVTDNDTSAIYKITYRR